MDGLDPDLLDPLVYDGRVAAVARALRRARRRISRGAAGRFDLDDLPSPWSGARSVSSKATVEATVQLASDPLFAALREWSTYLTIARVTHDDELAVARACAASAPAPELGDVSRSFGAMRDELLAEPRESPRRATLSTALAKRATSIQPIVRHWFERRIEAARQLRRSGFTTAAKAGPAVDSSQETLAERVLAIVASSGALPRARSLEGILEGAIARDASEGWPAHLTVRWLGGLFGDTELVRGVDVELEPDDLPQAIGGASFSRALGLFGIALFDADVPRTRPFVLSRRPDDERRYARRWLFALLPSLPSFGRAHLSLGADRARAQARSFSRALGVQAAITALAAASQVHVTLPEKRARSAFEETTACAFGETLAGTLLGVLPRARPDAGAELRGLVLACRDAEQLRDLFDEDWFKNPRAHESLRHDHAAIWTPVEAASLTEGLAAIERRLAEAVG